MVRFLVLAKVTEQKRKRGGGLSEKDIVFVQLSRETLKSPPELLLCSLIIAVDAISLGDCGGGDARLPMFRSVSLCPQLDASLEAVDRLGKVAGLRVADPASKPVCTIVAA